MKIVQSETFFPSLFFSPLPRGAKLVTSAENWIVSDTKKRGRGRVDKGQSASLAVPVVSIEITSRRIGKCDGAANGGEKLQSVGNCFIPFPARTQYRASLTRASTFKDFHLSQRWIPTTRGTEGQFFFPNALIPFLVIPIFPSVDISILFIISRREEGKNEILKAKAEEERRLRRRTNNKACRK